MNYSPYRNVPTFSQRHGLRELPGPPQLEHISDQARNNLWGALWGRMSDTATRTPYSTLLGPLWKRIFTTVHQHFMERPLDQMSMHLEDWKEICKPILLKGSYGQCFDLIETLLRHPQCPRDFVEEIKDIFRHQLAYRIDTTSMPAIVPAATEQEGRALIQAIQDMEDAELGGAATHLRQAGERIRDRDWAGSVRESIHALESVTKRVAPSDADTLRQALAALERQQGLHGALKKGFGALYGYASNEQGIRHALLEDESKVTQDEAIYMIGACAAFCSYLWRKFGSQGSASSAETTR